MLMSTAVVGVVRRKDEQATIEGIALSSLLNVDRYLLPGPL